MSLRLARSFRNLSSWFNHSGKISKRGQDPARTLLYVLLAPSDSKERYDDKIGVLASRVSSIEAIESWALLRNIRPPSGVPIAASSLAPKTAVHAMLLIMNSDMVSRVSDRVRSLLGNVANDDGRPILLWNMTCHPQIQAFQPRPSRHISGACKVTVSILPASGQDADVDAWYREENLKMLSASAPHLFLRSNRYMRLAGELDGAMAQTTEFLAIHEFTSVEALFQHSLHHGPITEDTLWSERVLNGPNKVQRTVWEVQ